MKISIKNYSQHFLSMNISTNIIIHFFSESKLWEVVHFYKTPYHFQNDATLCIFVHFTNSCFCFDLNKGRGDLKGARGNNNMGYRDVAHEQIKYEIFICGEG